MKKITIVHVTTHFFPVNGGQQYYINDLIESLPNFNHIVIQLKNGDYLYPPNVIAIEAPYFLGYKALRFYGFNIALRRKIKELIESKALDPNKDIIICNYAFHLSSVAQMKNRIALSHGVEWDGPGGFIKKIYHYHRYAVNRFYIKINKISIVANDINYYRQLDTMTNPSFYFKEVLPHRWLIPNSINTKKFIKTEAQDPPLPPKSIIIPRNIVPQRGMDIVIKEFSKLVNEENYKDYKLVIVGAIYDEEYYEHLRCLINTLRLEGSVIFYGAVPSEKMPLIYSAASLTIIFSLFREGTSLAALESMSCGTPVLTSAVGGLQEMPSIKSEERDLHKNMMEILANRDFFAEQQMRQVRAVYNHDNWITAWNKVLSRFVV